MLFDHLKNLTAAHARWFYRERLDSGLAPATVHKIHVVLHKALNAAVADGLIPRNAAAELKLPRITREEINPLSPEEVRHPLDAARSDRLEALYVLAIATGLRQGELLALEWEDVDLGCGVLRARRTLTREGSLGEPKTNKSRRSVKLTTTAVESLRLHLSRQLEEMERMGSLYRPGGLVFANQVGGIINPSPVLRAKTIPERFVGHYLFVLCPPMRVYTVPTVALEDVPTLWADPRTLHRNTLLAAAT